MKSLPNSPWQGLSLPSRKSCSERVVLDHRPKGGDGEVGRGDASHQFARNLLFKLFHVNPLLAIKGFKLSAEQPVLRCGDEF